MENFVENPDIRYIATKSGQQREVLSNDICCVCKNRIWVRSHKNSKVSVMEEAFTIIDKRFYSGEKIDYLKNSKDLLRCHFVCKNQLLDVLKNKE